MDASQFLKFNVTMTIKELGNITMGQIIKQKQHDVDVIFHGKSVLSHAFSLGHVVAVCHIQ